jgi:hypothetical protein
MFKWQICFKQITILLWFTINVPKSKLQTQCTLQLVRCSSLLIFTFLYVGRTSKIRASSSSRFSPSTANKTLNEVTVWRLKPLSWYSFRITHLFIWTFFFLTITDTIVGRNSSVGIATRYGSDGPGIESRWDLDLRHPSRPALGSTQPPIRWVPG